MGFFNSGNMRADLKCGGKEPSESDKLIIDAIGVISMSVSQDEFCKTFLVSGEFNTFEHETGEKEERMMEIYERRVEYVRYSFYRGMIGKVQFRATVYDFVHLAKLSILAVSNSFRVTF